jgi:hypothetical protein
MAQKTPRDLGDPVRLRARDDGGWVLKMTPELKQVGLAAGDSVLVDLDVAGEVPLLVVAKVDDPADDEQPGQNVRSVLGDGNSRWVKPPKPILESAERAGGLGLDHDSYDNTDALLFDPLPDPERGMIGLQPVGFESVVGDRGDESDGATTGEPTHPLPDTAVATAAEVTGVDREQVARALASVTDALASDPDLVTPAPGYERLSLPDREVVVVADETWAILQDRCDLPPDVVDAVRVAHTQTAEDLVVEHGDASYRRFSREFGAIVRE